MFLFFFCAFLLTTSATIPWSDGRMIYQVAQSLAARGAVDIQVVHRLGPDGKPYGVHPLLPSLVHVPGAWLQHRLGKAGLSPDLLWLASTVTCHIGSSLAGALACLMVFRLLCALRLGGRLAGAATAGFAFCTITWLYARYPYSEIVQLAAFTGLFAAVLAAGRSPAPWRGLWAGLWAGALLNTKLVYALCLPGALGWVAWRTRTDRRRLGRMVVEAIVGLLPWIAMILLYNHARWGTWLDAGYEVDKIPFVEKLWVGLFGLFLSPAKSLFVYSPPLLLAVVALARWRRDPGARDLLVLLLLLAGPIVLMTARLPFWSGDLAWGPRYLVFLTGALFAAVGLWLRRALQARKALPLAGGAALALLGLGVQLTANAFYWDISWRMAGAVRSRWLGVPDRQGTAFYKYQGTCEPCFEDLYHLLWLPPFNPIAINTWLIPHVWDHDTWPVAALDAPWRRYTTLPIDIADPYSRATFDWWYLSFRTQHRRAGLALAFALTLGAGAGGWLWTRGTRRRANGLT